MNADAGKPFPDCDEAVRGTTTVWAEMGDDGVLKKAAELRERYAVERKRKFAQTRTAEGEKEDERVSKVLKAKAETLKAKAEKWAGKLTITTQIAVPVVGDRGV